MSDTLEFTSLEEERDYLVGEIQHIEQQMSYRKAAIHGASGPAAQTEYVRWKARANAAKGHFIQRLKEVKDELRDQNIRYMEQSYAERFYRLRKAIQDHQRATLAEDYEPTKADIALWEAADGQLPA